MLIMDFQPLGEACRRSTVDQIMIQANRQTKIFPYGDVPVNDTWFHANPAHRNIDLVLHHRRDKTELLEHA